MFNRVCALGGLAFILLSPLWYGWVIYQDLTHPEMWDQDPLHDPRIYLPMLAVGAVFVALTLRWCYRTNCRTAEQMAELKQIEAMQMMGRTEESGRLMYEHIMKWELYKPRRLRRW
jgi:hypothetical protein